MGRIEQSVDSSNSNNFIPISDNESIVASITSVDSDDSITGRVAELRDVDVKLLELSTELKKLQLQSYNLADEISTLALNQHRLNSEISVRSARRAAKSTIRKTQTSISAFASGPSTTPQPTGTIISDITSPVTLFQDEKASKGTIRSTTPKQVYRESIPTNTPTTNSKPNSSTTKLTKGPLTVGTKVIVTNNYLGRKGVVGKIVRVTPAYYQIKPADGGKAFRRHHSNVKRHS